MAAKQTTQWSREDRDLLVKVSTQLESVIKDVKELKDGTATRLTNLESNKIDRSEAVQIQNENFRIQQDHEKRIRWVERIAYSGLTILAVAQFVVEIYLK